MKVFFNRSTIFRLILQRCFLALLPIGLSLGQIQNVRASPWVEPGNERTRHHLQNLVDSGASKTLVTSWPLMWSHVNQELKKIDPALLTDSALWSYQYLKHEIKAENVSKQTQQSGFLSNVAPAIRDFSSDSRNQQQASFDVDYTGAHGTFKIKASYVKDSSNELQTQYDGSHLSYLMGNWALGVGAIDRWWGPGWESSLILSNNARPIPSIFLQRNLASPFDSPLLSWLGPWQLTTFMAQLESQRFIPNAKLWGMRLNFRPLQSLEIGLSRTAMWGGRGRPEDIRTLANLLIGNDNRGDSGIQESGSNEPGNQLAGIDLRWGGSIGSYNGALYGQLIGEDEAGGLPSRHIGMIGVEFNGLFFDAQSRLSLEAENTTVYFYDSNKIAPNVAYEHPTIYKSGYRYHGLPLGASTDNDTESISLRSQTFLRNGHFANIAVSKHNMNMDGTNGPAPGGNVFGAEHINTYQFEASYSFPLLDHLMVKVGAFYFKEGLKIQNQNITNGAFLQFTTRW